MAEETSGNQYLHPRSASEQFDNTGAEESHGISINVSSGTPDGRPPPPIKHMSAPAYQSPIRHHRRTPSRSKEVKETLNARSSYGSGDDDGASVHRINQYVIKQEIGRGSFGAVHLAIDQYGQEYAVKEFSKARLRKRAQSNLLRKPNAGQRKPGAIAAGVGFNSPMHRLGASEKGSPSGSESNPSLDLIKEEIAIMKKLNHHNLVSLIEVLDDPQEDSLYMVLEMCKKGVSMRVGLDERADPYDDETCRHWFRDMILGIEYLHAQGIIHRDIKPDNCLVTEDDVLKIVDFGVSEMFEKQSEMATTKSAGSPAFMPPELCVAKHGQVRGRAADIWSMGVTLFCLRYGRIPFEKGSIMELYDSVRHDDLVLDGEKDESFADLMRRLLDKDPEMRITMDEIRNHSWVTRNGTDNLLSAEENCADLIEPPTEIEMNHAITGNMSNILAVVGAVKRFKGLVRDQRGRLMEGIFGPNSKLVAPPQSMRTQTRSVETHDRRPMDGLFVREGVHRDVEITDGMEKVPTELDKMASHPDQADVSLETSIHRLPGEDEVQHKDRIEAETKPPPERLNARSNTVPIMDFPYAGKGHAHDPLEDKVYLGIGHDSDAPEGYGDWLVSESPSAVELNIYEQAYQEEMDRILERRGREPSIYMNRRIEHRDDIRRLQYIKDAGKDAARRAAAKGYGLYTKYYADAESQAARREAAKKAATRVSDRWTSGSSTGEREGWRKWAKGHASDYRDYSKVAAKDAGEKIGGLYAKSGAREGLSDLVTRTQAKAKAEGAEGTVASPDQMSPATSLGTGAIKEPGDGIARQGSAPADLEGVTAEEPKMAPELGSVVVEETKKTPKLAGVATQITRKPVPPRLSEGT